MAPEGNPLDVKYPPGDAAPVRDPRFWESRYEAKDTGWDLGAAAPPIAEFFARASAPKPPARVIVPGCGRGHDALHLAKLGFEVLAVDFADPALAALRRRRRNLWIPAARCRTLRSDVVHLPARLAGSFDLWLEHTCFCAIDPALRDGYVRTAAQVLRPGGLFVGLMYPFREAGDGPPFPVSEGEVASRFRGAFEILSKETPHNSIERRRGEERLYVMRRN
jgi:SAM-dependent methyltransferase